MVLYRPHIPVIKVNQDHLHSVIHLAPDKAEPGINLQYYAILPVAIQYTGQFYKAHWGPMDVIDQFICKSRFDKTCLVVDAIDLDNKWEPTVSPRDWCNTLGGVNL